MSELIHNERTKLTATYLNSLAVATTAVGGVAPFVAIFTNGLSTLKALALGIGWLLASVSLHWIARRILGALKP